MEILHEQTIDYNWVISIKEISEKLFEMPLGNITSVNSGTFKDIIVDKVDSMETTLSHILPEMTANMIGSILLITYMLMNV